MSIMAWYPLPQSGSTPSAGDEFLDSQSAAWSLWSFDSADDEPDHRAEKRRNEQTEAPVPQQQQRTQPTDDIFMSQFSDEEMRRMDAPFEALDMFPDSMHRLLSYENMLSGVLTGSDSEGGHQDATLGVDTMDTCGFPLFSHDVQHAGESSPEVVPDLTLTPKDQVQSGVTTTKRSRSMADEESLFFQALVLQELEDVVFQLTKRTRICFRDAFFRLAEGSRAKCSAANANANANAAPSSETVQSADDSASRASIPGCPERETNAIDRTVADLTMKPPCPVSRRAGHSSGAEARSATSWMTTA